MAFLFGLAAYYLRSAILILAGGIILAIVTVVPAVVFSLSETFGWILAASGLIIGTGLPYFFRQYTIFLVTAMWGASFALSGVTLIFLGKTFDALRSLGSGTWIAMSVWLVLMGLGVYWQYQGHAKMAELTQTSDLDFLNRNFYACSTFSLAGLGNPVFIFAGAETDEIASDTPLDHIAWQMVEIPQNP